MLADDPCLTEVLRILELSDDGKPLLTVWCRHHVIVLRQIRVCAVRNTVLARVPGAHARRDDFQIALSGFSSSSDGMVLLSRGVALPGRLAAGCFGWTKTEEAGLSSRR